MNPIVEHELRLEGYLTRALELEGDGPPLLLFHGFGDSADTWRLLFDRLRKQGRAAVALDFPGFGKAQRLVPDEPVLPQLDDFAAAAIEYVAEEHGNGKRRAEVVIGGNSVGGTVALRAAERHGERIAGVVPIAPAGLDMPTWFTAIQGAPLVRAMLNSPVPVPQRTLRRAMASTYRVLAFSSPRKADDAVVGAFTQHYVSQRDIARLLGTGRTLLPELKAPFNFRNIDAPVLLVWGERDRMVASSGAERIVAGIPGTTVELFPRCGHCPQIEEPDRLAELLADFPPA
jgi:pimeloyl-ACP methyl ester carboxylesterase